MAKYISSKLTIKRRTFITNLAITDIEAMVPQFRKLSLLFGESNIYKLRANIDIKIIEAIILGQDLKTVKDWYVLENFAEILADKIVRDFMGDVRLKLVDPPLQDGEVPKEFILQKKFMMIDDYFNNEGNSLPLILKRIAGETEHTHKQRVQMYLMACPDTKFT